MHLQFCRDGRDITGDWYAEEDATEVRAWTPDATCLGSVEQVEPGHWLPNASDVADWVTLAEGPSFTCWADALAALGVNVADARDPLGDC
jgi:hypothetical protein